MTYTNPDEILLQRHLVRVDQNSIAEFVRDKSVIVTGAGGSIGSALCRVLARHNVRRLMAIDNSETALCALLDYMPWIQGRLIDVRDQDRVYGAFDGFHPDIVFHAAALKHVPLLQHEWQEAIRTNVFGTVNVVSAALRWEASTVFISTDKAVNPVSIMGATKRVAELYCQSVDWGQPETIRTVCVRFGNVLRSSGSVVPKFEAQIKAGGPVTVTLPTMERYFMTVGEACDLVMTAASHALPRSLPPSLVHSHPSIYVLNMGDPVRIVDLAERLIQLHGAKDIKIEFTGARPGERLREVLFAKGESVADLLCVPGVMAAHSAPTVLSVQGCLSTLRHATKVGDWATAIQILRDFAGYVPAEKIAA